MKINIVHKTKEIVRTYIEACINQGNTDIADKLFSPDFVGHGPLRNSYDREQWKQSVSMLRSTFPDYHLEINDLIAEGDKVVWRWTMTGTDLGGRDHQPPTGNYVEMYGINIERFKDDKIVETWSSSDHTPMEKALNANSSIQ